MISSIVLCSLLALVQSARPLSKLILDGRIVGGTTIDIAQVPFIVSVQYYDQHICAGSVLGPSVIITAAHCYTGIPPNNFKVRIGSSDNTSGGLYVAVDNIIPHPEYNELILENDVALLTLRSPSNVVGYAKLPQVRQVPQDGTAVTVSGWGVSGNPQESNAILRSVDVYLINRETCKTSYAAVDAIITDRMICAGTQQGGRDACQGDSGGPLMYNDILVGIVSWGYGCGDAKYPGVYTDVSSVRDWISEVSGI